MWYAFKNGGSIGSLGSESGVIVLDEEHADGARISLERGGRTSPWSITCGIYGEFLHTAFASSEEEGRAKYLAMQVELVAILQEESKDLRYDKMQLFSERF